MVQKKCYKELEVYEIMYSKTIKKEKKYSHRKLVHERKYEEKNKIKKNKT